jgi:hypothetical protein
MENLDHIVDVRIEVDIRPKKVPALAEAGQRYRVSSVATRAKCFGQRLKVPAAVPAAWHQNEGRHSVHRNRPLKAAGMIGGVCTRGAYPAGIPSRWA